ncbi:MAG: metallopeptidase TldD-related protein, partial [Candidatus Heimdallarchaeota archaeon]
NESYMIRNGRVEEPVKNPVLELTTPAIYSSIDAIGKKVELISGTCGKGEPTQGVPVTFGGPYIRMRKIRVKHK